MKVSIIITAYNVEKYIEQAIKSALKQTHADIEVVVVLDKPTDDTATIVKNIANTDDRIVVVENAENVGAGMSRRIGIETSTGDYILTLDGDDWIDRDFISALVDEAEQTGADIVGGGITIEYGDGTYDVRGYTHGVYEDYERIMLDWKKRLVFMNSKIVSRRVCNLHRYSHRRYIEDTQTIIPMMWYARKVAYIDNNGYHYRQNDQSLCHTQGDLKRIVCKGLCWCDLYDFFLFHDKKFLEVCAMRESFLREVIKPLNDLKPTPQMLAPMKEEWCELTMKIPQICDISAVIFNLDKQPQKRFNIN